MRREEPGVVKQPVCVVEGAQAALAAIAVGQSQRPLEVEQGNTLPPASENLRITVRITHEFGRTAMGEEPAADRPKWRPA